MTVGPEASPARPAERYGSPRRRALSPRARWVAITLALVVAVLLVGVASWARGRANVSWVNLPAQGPTTPAETAATFHIEAPPGRAAVCTIRAVNARLTEVGRREVEIPPSSTGGTTMTITLQTSELATGAGVKSCVLR